MSYNATGNSAGRRIATLLDEGSFVEIGGAVTARSTDFNLQETRFQDVILPLQNTRVRRQVLSTVSEQKRIF